MARLTTATALAVVSTAVMLGMSVWFAASAVGPVLEARWSLGPVEAGWLTALVQLGFVAGTLTAALLGVADVLESRHYFAGSALAAALANAALLFVPGYEAALVSRFATGFFLAGVYPPAMKMTATWFVENRGLAIGVVVGALTVGKALPYLVEALGAERPHAAGPVVVVTSAAAALGALLVFGVYRDGPHAFPRRRFSWKHARDVVSSRRWRLATGGYLGHMWELYAGWTIWGSYFLAFFTAHDHPSPTFAAGLSTFVCIAAGGAGSVAAGQAADRWGRERVASWSMAASGACAMSMGWLMAAPAWLVLAVAVTWGAAIVADSAQFSALVTEVAPPHAVGTALTLQTSLGFALTAGSIWLTFELVNRVGYGFALAQLAVGPAFGIWCMAKLKKIRMPERHRASSA